MYFLSKRLDERGQGLVEYALILVLVAVVVIAVLLQVGPVIGDVFSRITIALGVADPGVITSVVATRTGGGNGNDVNVSITVATNTSVTVTDSQNASPQTAACNGTCTVTLTSVGPAQGFVMVAASAGGTAMDNYEAKN